MTAPKAHRLRRGARREVGEIAHALKLRRVAGRCGGRVRFATFDDVVPAALLACPNLGPVRLLSCSTCGGWHLFPLRSARRAS